MAKQDKNFEVQPDIEMPVELSLSNEAPEAILGDAPREVTLPPYTYGQRVYTSFGKEGTVVSISSELVRIKFDDLTETSFSL